MDILDRLLADMHLRGASIVDSALSPSFSLDVPAVHGAVFHMVLAAPEAISVQCGDVQEFLQPGDVAVVPGGLAHSVGDSPAPAAMSALTFDTQVSTAGLAGDNLRSVRLMSVKAHLDAELAGPVMAALPRVFLVRPEKPGIPVWIATGVQFIRQELESSLPAYQAVANRVAEILFIECLRRFVSRIPPDSQSWLRAVRDPALSRVLSAIHAEPGERWSVNRLAKIANLSRSAFVSRFTRFMGLSPIAYLTAHRLRRAAWQLRNTAMPIARIAEEAGYAGSSSFCQSFERHRGCSPRQYRLRSGKRPDRDAARPGSTGADRPGNLARLRHTPP